MNIVSVRTYKSSTIKNKSQNMMSNVCRLCLSSDVLFDIFQFDGDIGLEMKISSCINVEIRLNDNLPAMICKACMNVITKFYNFKQECLRVDSQLRTNYSHLLNRNNNVNTLKSNINCKEGNDYFNILTHANNETLPSTLSSEEKPLIKLDSHKRELKPDYNSENKDACENKYQCEKCGRVFKMKSGLDNHLITHSGTKRYECKLCPKRFCRAENLAVHTLTHSGIKPYICEVCGRLSTRRQDLIRHMKIHSDKKDYACPQCNRSFKRSSDVSSHMRTHTGMRPYHCKKCAKTYTSHGGLRKHKIHCK